MNLYLAPDAHTGRHSLRSNKVRSDVFSARELAEMTQGEERIFWEFSGHVNGVALYVRIRFVGQQDGRLVGYSSEGTRIVIHPADRKVRVITG